MSLMKSVIYLIQILDYTNVNHIMLIFLSSFTIISVIGTVAAKESYIDINRIHLLPHENSYFGSSSSQERQGSVSEEKQSYHFRTNDYDDHSSSGYHRLPKSLRLHIPSIHSKSTEKPHKVYPPREDPRLFYESDAYLKENDRQHVNQEVTFIYPGSEVNHAARREMYKSMPLRTQDRILNSIDGANNVCIKCPRDRTLIVRAGSDKVLLQYPRLFSCSGLKAPRHVRFIHTYGPKFGSLLEQGSHQIIGQIIYKNSSIQLCKMQVHVIMQSCATPKYLISHCEEHNCTFTCRDSEAGLHGQPSLICGSDMKWIGELPLCKARTWCDQPLPPEHGRISCKGAIVGAGRSLTEGSRCKLRCNKGWRWHPRAVSVCRSGEWTKTLNCQRTVSYSQNQRKSKRNNT